MKLAVRILVVSGLFALLAGCSSLSLRSPGKRDPGSATKPSGGGYYKDDGPGANPPADLAAIPDAVPRIEPLHRYANRPYTALGKSFTPRPPDQAYQASGLGSWYGRRFHGKATASGEPYDMYAMTAAHPTLPIPSYVRVSNPRNGKSVIVRINDRGPFHEDRLIDLSYTAAWKLDLLRGVSRVDVETVFPGSSAVPPQGSEAQPALVTGIYLQLAALASTEAADALIRRVRDSTLQLPGLHRIDTNSLVKVQAGPYVEAQSADAAARDIERELGLKPYRISR